MLQTVDSSVNAYENKFILTVGCNMEHADLGPTEFAVEIQSMKFVISAEYCEMRGRLFGRLAGLAFNSKHRAVALDAATFIHLGSRLARDTGSMGTAALYQEGREYARRVVEFVGQTLHTSEQLGHTLYFDIEQAEDLEEPPIQAFCMKCRMMREIRTPRQVLLSNKSHALQGVCAVCATRVFKIGARYYGKIKGGTLIENAQAFLAAAGWGTFELRSAIEGRLGAVTISDPPTIDGEVPPGNQFVEGISAGLLEKASSSGNRMQLVGEKYDRFSRTLTLHFAEQILTKAKHPAPLRKIKGRPVKKEIPTQPAAKAIAPINEEVGEVNRIIRSLEKIESEARTSIGQNGEEENKERTGPLVLEPVAAAKTSNEST